MARRGVSRVHAETDWTLQRAEAVTALPSDGPAAVAYYERWFTAPAAQAREFADGLAIPGGGDDDAGVAGAVDAVRADLRHHAASDVPASVGGRLYALLDAYRRGARPG
jgi:hypothetical protein